ncbi:MAG: hypothetical protein ACERKU_05490 [Nitrospirota bacterium]
MIVIKYDTLVLVLLRDLALLMLSPSLPAHSDLLLLQAMGHNP